MSDVKCTKQTDLRNVGYCFRDGYGAVQCKGLSARLDTVDARHQGEVEYVKGQISDYFDDYKEEIKEQLGGSFNDITSMLKQHKMTWEFENVIYHGYNILFKPDASSNDLMYSIRMLDNNRDGLIDSMTIREHVLHRENVRHGLFREKLEYYSDDVLFSLDSPDLQSFFSALLAVGLESEGK